MSWEGQETDSQQSASENNTEGSASEEEGAKAVREKTKSRKVKPKKSKFVYEGMSVEQMQIHLQIVRLENEKAVELKKLENERAEKVRKVEAEVEQKKIEVEQKRIELEMKKLEVEEKSREIPKSFRIDNAVKSVPIFVENEVDAFFLQFEKVAEQREWPRTSWSTLVQTSFRGKAREVFAALSLDDSKDYERVKSEVLKAYEWVPERYREKFRSWIKRESRTHMEYAREQRLWYDRWMNAREVNGDFGKLQELILLEQFKDGINPLIKTYLDERDVDNVDEATRLSDNYALTHKLYNTDVTPKIGRSRVWEEQQNYKAQGKTTSSQVSSRGVYNESFNRGGRGASQYNSGPNVSAGQAGYSVNDQFTPSYQNIGENFRDFVCFSCGKPGHISRSCPHRTINRPIQVVNKVKDKPVHFKDDHKPENTIALLNQPQACGDRDPCLFASPLRPGKRYCNDGIDSNNICDVDENIGYKIGNNDVQNVSNVGCIEDIVKGNGVRLPEEKSTSKGTELYDPFMGDGWLHLPCVEKRKVRWLRDTGAVQSVMIKNMYDQWKDTGEYVLLRGFGPDFSAPLVEVRLETPLISGYVKIALVREIPVSGVELILGNDVCGDKVFGSSNPILTEKPFNSSFITEVECTFPNLFPACAVTTRSKSAEGKVNDDDGLDLQNLFKDGPETLQSQGVVERFHRTFKTMLRTYCCENEKEWDVYIPMLLFAIRDSVHSSLGYSPFQLVYVHQVRSPMEVIKNQLISDEKDSITLQEMKEKIKKIWKVAHENLKVVQEEMKRNYDKKAAKRELDIGDKVLVYLPTAGKVFNQKYIGPCTVKEKVSDVNYRIQFPTGRRKVKTFHINKLKKYNESSGVLSIAKEDDEKDVEEEIELRLKNTDYLSDDEKFRKLCIHLSDEQQHDFKVLIQNFSDLFSDHPKRIKEVQHKIRLREETPIISINI
ncbi:uncharacterized protein LOC135212849 [Macrobrachium nipponense]|uniref:uncharacterized protein LOC135212849 n=1 Tax=Macrobrachium nipponense TaxID=159736 RepID=UPI0030C8A7D8